MNKFKVGDKVKAVAGQHIGEDFTVIFCGVTYCGTPHVICRGDLFGGIVIPNEELELVIPKKTITISNTGDSTIATLIEDGHYSKSFASICSEDDTYDFEASARIAFDGLFKKEEFRPHLKGLMTDKHYGYIGEETNLSALGGVPLFVGDTVTIYCSGLLWSVETVVKDKNESFIMGLKDMTFSNGVSEDSNWIIYKACPHQDIENETRMGGIQYIKKGV